MPPTGASSADVVRAILQIQREFMDAVLAKDASRVARIYTEDGRILMPGRPAISGRKEILAFWKWALDGLVESVALDTTNVETSGDLAYEFGHSTVTLRPKGEAPREEKGKYVTVHRRQPSGGWKIVADSYSADA